MSDDDSNEVDMPAALLRERSGSVSSSNPWAALLYDLLRDGPVHPGDLEKLVRDATVPVDGEPMRFNYTNGFLAKYAHDIVTRMEAAKKQDLTMTTILMDRLYQELRTAGKSPYDAMRTVVEKLLSGDF